MDNIIKVNNLTKIYDNFKLDNITLNIKKGSISGKAGDESLKALCKGYLQPHYHSRYSLKPKARIWRDASGRT